MKLEHDICYQALKTRDARFDGRFFTGVSSTGIFCRPVCPAATPKPENCTFFPSASAAMNAGFRPCLRCRPESAPASPAWLGTQATVNRALRLIEEGALDEGKSLEDLCDRLGVGERHLRRLFQTHLGASPTQVAQTRRLMFAKKLLVQTDASVTEVALAAGFNSLRRFNDAYKGAFDLSPSQERKTGTKVKQGQELNLHFNYRPPFDWEGLLGFFETRALDPVEKVVDGHYRRVLELDGVEIIVIISNDASRNRLKASITGASVLALRTISNRIRRVFDLDADPDAIAHDLSTNPIWRPLVTQWPGVRVPGAWDPFEIAVRAVVGQQISVKGARTILMRMIERIGRGVFPTPQDIVESNLDGLGLTGRRIATLKNLAGQWQGLDKAKSVEAICTDLCALPGIGPWTANYIIMRALGEPDTYPVADLGLIRALEKLGHENVKNEMEDIFNRVRPWRAYGALYLWKVLE